MRYAKVADIMGGNIYVINLQGVEVFDTETQMWVPEMKKTDMELQRICFRPGHSGLRIEFGSVRFGFGSFGSYIFGSYIFGSN